MAFSFLWDDFWIDYPDKEHESFLLDWPTPYKPADVKESRGENEPLFME